MLAYDVIKKCDIAQTIRIWLDVWADEDERKEEHKSVEINTRFLEMLRTVTPVPSYEWVIVATKCYEDNKVFVDASWKYGKTDVENTLSSIKEITFPIYDENDTIENLKNVYHSIYYGSIGRILPANSDYEWSPWEMALGFEVFEGNIERMGVDAVAASMLYELSFEGYTKEIHDRWYHALVNDNDDALDDDELLDDDEILDDEEDDTEILPDNEGNPSCKNDFDERMEILGELKSLELEFLEFQRICRDREEQGGKEGNP